MIIRDLRDEDNEEVTAILKQHNFEYPKTSPIITQAVVQEGLNVIAYGAVRLIAEEVMILDRGCSNRQKSQVLQLLHKRGIEDSHAAGFDQLHAFVQDPHFIDVLKKHYGYRECKGKAIVMIL